MSIGGHSLSARAGLEGKPDTVGDLASPAPEPSLRNGQFGGCPPQGRSPEQFKLPLYRCQLQDPGRLVSSPANSRWVSLYSTLETARDWRHFQFTTCRIPFTSGNNRDTADSQAGKALSRTAKHKVLLLPGCFLHWSLRVVLSSIFDAPHGSHDPRSGNTASWSALCTSFERYLLSEAESRTRSLPQHF